ncbi:MAG TPA: SHOCT domain-containing protein [Candidatus Limnocylindrales bacterium]|nr:SHOCT domain-containing protein [Candidatus Limnocylindrales bacterium]
MLIWVGALLAMVWLLVRPADQSRYPDAMAILRARYARGELTDAEFQHAQHLLRDDPEDRK